MQNISLYTPQLEALKEILGSKFPLTSVVNAQD